jgi:DNA-binding CsgD family transcriptional regulator
MRVVRLTMQLAQNLIALAHAQPGSAFRGAALDLLADRFDAEVGLFAWSQNERAERGLVPCRPALARGWDDYGRELAPVYAAAARMGAARDVDVLGHSALARTRVYREVMAPRGGRESLFVIPQHRGQKLGVLMLGRTRGVFSRGAHAELSALVPLLGLACAALAATPLPPAEGARLTDTEAELLRYLALGHSTRDIAAARGTSFFTVRNQLSALFRKLGVANRTEAVGLARVR